MYRFRKGDTVMVGFRGQQTTGEIRFASRNGKSLMLEVKFLGGYIGVMPVLWDDAKQEFQDLINRDKVELAIRS